MAVQNCNRLHTIKAVNAWSSRWLVSEASILELGVSVTSDLLDINVVDLVNNDGSWDLDRLTDWMPVEILDYFSTMLPPTNNNTVDSPVWPFSNDGTYRVSDGYKVLYNLVYTDANPLWQKIWKLSTKERTRHHVWLVLHVRLPTNARMAKILLSNANCYHCHNDIETTLHILRDCPIARNIWLHLINRNKREDFFAGNLSNWVALNLSTEMGNYSDLDWSALWANTVHLLWQWRNKATHEDDFVFPWIPWLVAIKETSDYNTIQHLQVQKLTDTRYTKLITWKPPEDSSIKLNTDGSSLVAVGLAGCGGLFRDMHGTWKVGYSKSLSRCAYLAELWEVYEGLLLAQSKGYLDLTVEVDAIEIVNTMQKNLHGRGEGRSLFRRIRELVNDVKWKVQFQHTYKQANICAHLLASSHQIDSLVIHDVIPTDICKAVENDVRGVGIPRVVRV